MRARKALAGALATALVCGGGLAAHVRLINSSNGNPLSWDEPTNVPIVIQSDGSDDEPGSADEVAVRLAIQSWNDVAGSSAFLAEDTDPAEQARTDWQSGIHLVLFDETNSSGFFGGNGVVAVTPLLFSASGRILDADVLFNGADWSFTASGAPGAFDIQDVAAHELGHLLGLNHSGAASSTMYPFVDPTVILHRSLSEDEASGMRHVSPAVPFGELAGRIERLADGSPVAGAFVVARDADGRTAASILSDAAGDFTLEGLEPGTYTVYADPLDEPVSVAHLGAGYPVETDFQSTVYPVPAVLVGSETVALGTLSVGADAALNLGNHSFDVYPIRVVSGTAASITVRGSGLDAGSTLSASDPDILLSGVVWFGNRVTFQASVLANEQRGHVDLTVANLAGDVSILPAALEITPPAPVVATVDPGMGSSNGGTALTITGTGFLAGARIVIGDRIYRDGIEATVAGPTTITLTTAATIEGVHDVVVLDASGIEGRLPGGFEAAALPVIATAFPVAGDAAGGTQVTLTGSNFQAGLSVRIDGVEQAGVSIEDGTTITFATTGGPAVPGSMIEVENPGGGLATVAFTYVAQADPSPMSVDPPSTGSSGGATVNVLGADFPPDAEVVFGADPDTGEGGVAATSVVWIDSGTLEVVTPSHPTGPASVLVRDASSAQAALLAAAVNFTSSGGGGGCHVIPAGGPGGPREALASSWWAALLAAALLVLRARTPRRARAAAAARR